MSRPASEQTEIQTFPGEKGHENVGCENGKSNFACVHVATV